MELMFHLSVLPLTRQLTNISGNLWGRTLQVNICSTIQAGACRFVSDVYFFRVPGHRE